MADQMRETLGKMLDQYDERRRGDQARMQQSRDADAQFLARFAELRRDVVKPVFEAAGALLAARGHEFRISEDDFSTDSGGKVTEAGISIQFQPAGASSPRPAATAALIHHRERSRIANNEFGAIPNFMALRPRRRCR